MGQFWCSKVPEKCQVTGHKIEDIFYDTRIACTGQWACLSPGGNVIYGITHGDDNKLGTGVGQKYEKQLDGSFRKVAG